MAGEAARGDIDALVRALTRSMADPDAEPAAACDAFGAVLGRLLGDLARCADALERLAAGRPRTMADVNLDL